jgi:phosphate:Na+ symporter
MTTFSILHLFSLAGGVSLFLYGMQQGEKNLKNFSASRLKAALAVITHNRLLAYLFGAMATVATQSSSATTVMLVGLASARVVSLQQTLGMILGAGLGTTITVQLFAFKFQELAPLLIAIGFILSLTKKNRFFSRYGHLILAAGLVFFGMKMMADSVAPLKAIPVIHHLIGASLHNPFFGLMTSFLFTAVVQSSAATLAMVIAIAQSLSANDAMPLTIGAYLPMVLGANMGTCATAFLATIGAATEGKRVAWAHFAFKLAGAVMVFPLIQPIETLAGSWRLSPAFGIALTHTGYNLLLAIIFLPLLRQSARLLSRLVPEGNGRASPGYHCHFLHAKALAIPGLALTQAGREIVRMAEMVRAMARTGLAIINEYSVTRRQEIVEADDYVDYLHESILKYLTQLSQSELTTEDSIKAYELIMVTTDLEHIGDTLSKSIVTLAEKADLSIMPFPGSEREELAHFFGKTCDLLDQSIESFSYNNKELASMVYDRRHELIKRFDRYTERHIGAMYSNHDPALTQTAIYVDLLEEINRINTYSIRLAAHVLEIYRVE